MWLVSDLKPTNQLMNAGKLLGFMHGHREVLEPLRTYINY